MSSDPSNIEFLVEQFAGAGQIRSRKMFGDYALYCNDKIFALVCDNQLFMKPTEAGRAFLKTPEEKPPYPGAKMWFWISTEHWDDDTWLVELLRISLPELPLPKPKKLKKLSK